MFYSKSTGGFYSREIHGDNIPADAVEITDEEHAALMAGQSAGKRIIPDETGRPTLAAPPPPSSADLAAETRAKRDRLMSESDWIVTRSIETAADVPPEWLSYRQALRDVPQQPGFPESIDWPDLPDGI